uniref:Uncharacterized protein n=1 Tax=Opuntia streptacantha TaxID=393608 RepID=A0A7C8ZN10_OPUST
MYNICLCILSATRPSRTRGQIELNKKASWVDHLLHACNDCGDCRRHQIQQPRSSDRCSPHVQRCCCFGHFLVCCLGCWVETHISSVLWVLSLRGPRSPLVCAAHLARLRVLDVQSHSQNPQ